MEMNFVSKEGYNMNFWSSGTMLFGLAVVISNVKVFIISFEHSIMSIFFNLGSMLLYLCSVIVISTFFESSTIYVLFMRYYFLFFISFSFYINITLI
jgi:phospholipid-transporting ATPase